MFIINTTKTQNNCNGRAVNTIIISTYAVMQNRKTMK